MNVLCTPYAFGFLDLAHKVVEVSYTGGSRIGDAVSGYDLKHILFLSEIAVDILAGRGCCCPCAEGCQGTFLNTCVHIGFIVITDIKDIVIPVYRTGKSLQTDIRCTAVTGKAYRMKTGYSLRFQSGLYTGQHGGCSGKGGDNGIIAEAKLREVKAYRRHTAGRQYGNSIFS